VNDDRSISDKIPLPGRMIKYRFATMKIGESFAVKSEELHKVRAAASAYGKTHKKRFTVRLIDPDTKSYRCWRIEDREE
jgi:hypothetical protein